MILTSISFREVYLEKSHENMKYSKFENFESALYSTSESMPLREYISGFHL